MASASATAAPTASLPKVGSLPPGDILKTQLGGAKFQQHVLDWSKQSQQLYVTVLFALLFIWATYSEKIPPTYRWQLNTTLGRLLLLILLYTVHLMAGWVPALLFAIAIALTWANRPLYRPSSSHEGFQDNVKVTDVNPHMWFVEQALQENPRRIVQDRIQTFAVQEENTSGSSRTSR